MSSTCNENEVNASLQYDNRKCSLDWMYCLVLAIASTFYIAIAITSGFNTNTEVFFPYDEDGNVCGQGGLLDYDKLYFYQLYTELFNKRVCVSECPKKSNGLLKCFPTSNNRNCRIDNKVFYASQEMDHFCVSTEYDIRQYSQKANLFDELIDKIRSSPVIHVVFGIKLSSSFFIYLPLVAILSSIGFLMLTLGFPRVTFVVIIVLITCAIGVLDLFLLNALRCIIPYTFTIDIFLGGISTLPSVAFMWLLSKYAAVYRDSILDIYNNSLWKYHLHLPFIVFLLLFGIYSFILFLSYNVLLNLLCKINKSAIPLSVLPPSELYSSISISPMSIIQMAYVILFSFFILLLLSQMCKYIYAQYAYKTISSLNRSSFANIIDSIWLLLRYHFGSVIWISYRSVYMQFTITNCIAPNRKENFSYLVKNGKCLISNTDYNRQYIRLGLISIASILLLVYSIALYHTLLGVYVSFCLWMFVSIPIANWIITFPSSFNDILNFEKESATPVPHFELASM